MKTWYKQNGYRFNQDESDHIAIKLLVALVLMSLAIWCLPKIIELAVLTGMLVGDKL